MSTVTKATNDQRDQETRRETAWTGGGRRVQTVGISSSEIRENKQMMANRKLDVRQNPFNSTWDIGWCSVEDGETFFEPYVYDLATKAEAEAQIPGLERSMKRARAERARQARLRLKPMNK